jgi:hypothetical protein
MFSRYTKHMNKYEMKTNIVWLTRKRDALIKKLADIGPFVDGSFVKIKRRCGNKNCKCYLKDEKHESYCLMYKTKGVTKAVYVPVDLEEQVRSWNKEHKRLKRILSEVSKINKEIIRRYVKEKQLKKGRS